MNAAQEKMVIDYIHNQADRSGVIADSAERNSFASAYHAGKRNAMLEVLALIERTVPNRD